jgi:type IX secretion system PorP/SprF family membrane protein
MKKYTLLFVAWVSVIFLVCQEARGQDPNFTQFFNAPTYYNPAFTGLNTGLRARFTYRNQWPNLPSSYKSYFFSTDIGDRNLPGSGGLGLIVNSDNQGVGFIRNLSMGINLGVRIPLAEYVISQVGIRASIVQKSVNWDDFVFTDQLNEKYGNIYSSAFQKPDNNKKVFPDFGFGGLIQFSNEASRYYGTAGVSLDHVFEPDEGFLTTGKSPLPRKWVAHTDFIITTGEDAGYSGGARGAGDPLKLNPGIIYQEQAGFSTLQAGMNLLKYNVYLGAWYKADMGTNGSNILALVAGYRYQFTDEMSIKFMYSYDLQIAGPAGGTGGAHEISLILEFDKMTLFGGGGSGNYSAHKRYSPIECSSF